MSGKGHFEECWTPIAEPRRPYEEVFQKMERYEKALKKIKWLDANGWAREIAEEALNA